MLAIENFRSDQFGNIIGQETSTRTYLENRILIWRQECCDGSVPFLIDLSQEGFLADKRPAKISAAWAIYIQPTREGMGQQILKH
jgi:hypothetical protein